MVRRHPPPEQRPLLVGRRGNVSSARSYRALNTTSEDSLHEEYTVQTHCPRARRQAPAPITVTLPDLPSVPPAYWGKDYKVFNLVGDGDSNSKLYKSNQAGKGYRTYGLSLAPADSSGHQL